MLSADRDRRVGGVDQVDAGVEQAWSVRIAWSSSGRPASERGMAPSPIGKT
jgi:hypothetical protein